MASRFTDTNKWKDQWYRSLDTLGKLMWNYICDNCDQCGYMEYLPDLMAYDLKVSEAEIERVSKGLGKGIIWSDDGSCFIIKKFLFHQKNLPLGASPVHKGIASRWYSVSSKFSNYVLDSNLGIVKGNDTLSQPYPNPKLRVTIPLGNPNERVKEGLPNPYSNSNSNSNSNSRDKIGGVGEREGNPTINQVRAFFVENGFRIDVGEKAFWHYDRLGWKDAGGTAVRDWRGKMRAVWFKPENKMQGVDFDPVKAKKDADEFFESRMGPADLHGYYRDTDDDQQGIEGGDE